MPDIKASPLLLALGVLLAGLALTGFLWVRASRMAAEQTQSDLQHDASVISQRLERQLHQHALMLKGFAGLFNASSEVSRSDFHQYFQTLHDKPNTLGVAAVAYHEIVLAKDLARHIDELKKEGFEDYRVFPEGARDVYGPERFVEPFIGNNLKVSLEAAAQDADTQCAVDAAHKLKSAARSVGALVLGALCQEIETAGQAGDSAACQALIAKVNDTLAQAEERIVAYQAMTAVVTKPSPDKDSE